jgi:hypothetical protein
MCRHWLKSLRPWESKEHQLHTTIWSAPKSLLDQNDSDQLIYFCEPHVTLCVDFETRTNRLPYATSTVLSDIDPTREDILYLQKDNCSTWTLMDDVCTHTIIYPPRVLSGRKIGYVTRRPCWLPSTVIRSDELTCLFKLVFTFGCWWKTNIVSNSGERQSVQTDIVTF